MYGHGHINLLTLWWFAIYFIASKLRHIELWLNLDEFSQNHSRSISSGHLGSDNLLMYLH